MKPLSIIINISRDEIQQIALIVHSKVERKSGNAVYADSLVIAEKIIDYINSLLAINL